MTSNLQITRVLLAFAVALSFTVQIPLTSNAQPNPADQIFYGWWMRSDQPVSEGLVNRTWMWGPTRSSVGRVEEYVDAPRQQRQVRYLDKSRMEMNHDPRVSSDSPWYVTNGLLVVELMTGKLQLGDNYFKQYAPSNLAIAGDQSPYNLVSYRFMSFLTDEPPEPANSVITKMLAAGSARNAYLIGEDLRKHGVTATVYVPETNHRVASVFWDFMNSSGLIYGPSGLEYGNLFLTPFYATGLPVTEAYWAMVPLGGIQTEVLVQCFERRCLTYTPSNPEGWKVEAGNVGRHYYAWRYGAQLP